MSSTRGKFLVLLLPRDEGGLPNFLLPAKVSQPGGVELLPLQPCLLQLGSGVHLLRPVLHNVQNLLDAQVARRYALHVLVVILYFDEGLGLDPAGVEPEGGVRQGTGGGAGGRAGAVEVAASHLTLVSTVHSGLDARAGSLVTLAMNSRAERALPDSGENCTKMREICFNCMESVVPRAAMFGGQSAGSFPTEIF